MLIPSWFLNDFATIDRKHNQSIEKVFPPPRLLSKRGIQSMKHVEKKSVIGFFVFCDVLNKSNR